MPFSLIPFFLLVIPIAEIAVFILIGREIGVLATLGAVLVTAIIGSVLLRVQGLALVNRIRAELEADRVPGKDLRNGAMILVAGILLLTPGFVTDSIGFLLFVPAFRDLLWRMLSSRLVVVASRSTTRSGPQRPQGPQDRVVDLDPEDFSERGNPDSPWNKD